MMKLLLSAPMLFLGLLAAGQVSAATIRIQPDRYTVKVGETFSAVIFIDSEDSGVNAVQATLQFPAALVEVSKLDQSSSVLNYWLDGPAYSNEDGTVSFIGGSSDGMTGKSLQALNVFFKVKSAGSIPLTLSDAAITASDGSGTNVLTTMRGATIDAGGTLPPSTSPPPVATSTQPSLPQPLPLKPVPPTQIVRKPTLATQSPATIKLDVPFYPDPAKWYKSKQTFLVSWNLPTDISDVATALNKDPKFNPRTSEGLFDNKLFLIEEDGVWYLHVRFKNNIGWGETAHYRLAVDSIPPTPFSIRVAEGAETDNPSPTISYGGGDALSGIGTYVILVDARPPFRTSSATTTLPLLPPGTHNVRVEAFDLAGNVTESSIAIQTIPIPSPVLISWNANVYIGEGRLEVVGTAAQDVTVWLGLKTMAGELVATQSAMPDQQGNWRSIFDMPLKSGQYYVEAVSQDARGALSLPSRSDDIRVSQRPVLTIGGIGITSSVLLFIILLAVIGAFGAGRYLQFQQEQRVGWRALVAKRDIYGFLESMETDLNRALSKFDDNNSLSASGATDIHYQIKHILARIEKMKYYLPEGISDIPEKKKHS